MRIVLFGKRSEGTIGIGRGAAAGAIAAACLAVVIWCAVADAGQRVGGAAPDLSVGGLGATSAHRPAAAPEMIRLAQRDAASERRASERRGPKQSADADTSDGERTPKGRGAGVADSQAETEAATERRPRAAAKAKEDEARGRAIERERPARARRDKAGEATEGEGAEGDEAEAERAPEEAGEEAAGAVPEGEEEPGAEPTPPEAAEEEQEEAPAEEEPAEPEAKEPSAAPSKAPERQRTAEAKRPVRPVLSRKTEKARQEMITSSLTRLAAALKDRETPEAERLRAAGRVISSARMRLAALQTEISRSRKQLDDVSERGEKLRDQLARVPRLTREGKVPAMYAEAIREDADETVTRMNEVFDEAIDRRAELTEDVGEYRAARKAAEAMPSRLGGSGLGDHLSRAAQVLGDVVAAITELNGILDETIATTVDVSEAAAKLSLELTQAIKLTRSRGLLTQTSPPIGVDTLGTLGGEVEALRGSALTEMDTARQRLSQVSVPAGITYTLLLVVGVIVAWWGTGVASKRLAEYAVPEIGTASDELARAIRLLMPAVRAALLVLAAPLLLAAWNLPEGWADAVQTVLLAWVGYYLLMFVLRQLVAPTRPQMRILAWGDDVAQNLYRTVRGLALYAAIALPVLLLLSRMQERPDELVRVIQVVYGAGLLVIGAMLVRASGGLGQLLPEGDTAQKAAFRQAGKIAVPLAAVTIAAAAGAAAGGYSNLSTYVNRCLSLEILVLVAAVFADQLVLRGPQARTRPWRRYGRWMVWGAVVLLQIPIWQLHAYHATFVYGVLSRPIVTVGEREVTAIRIVKGLLIAVAFYLIAGVVRNYVRGWDYLTQRFQAGVAYALSSLSFYLILVAGLLWGILATGFELSVLTVFAGMAGIGVGFGLQDVVRNFISGLILLVERPVAVGDWVEVGNLQGQIKDINLRSTTIRSRDNNIVLVPNSDLAAMQVTNLTLSDRRVRMTVEIGVHYSSDLKLVRRVLEDCIDKQQDILDYPEPRVLLDNFGSSSVDFRVLAWVADIDTAILAAPALRQEIWDAFAENDIEIPFPQSDLHIRSSDIPLPYEGPERREGNGSWADDTAGEGRDEKKR